MVIRNMHPVADRPALPLTGCVSLSKLLRLSELLFSSPQTGLVARINGDEVFKCLAGPVSLEVMAPHGPDQILSR